jgi:hypothetical protein
VAFSSAPWQEIRVRFGPSDKGRGGASIWIGNGAEVNRIGFGKTSVFGRLFFDVIDDQHGRWTPLLLQFQPKLSADGIE